MTDMIARLFHQRKLITSIRYNRLKGRVISYALMDFAEFRLCCSFSKTV